MHVPKPSAMKSLWYLISIVSIVSAVSSAARSVPPDGAIVVAKFGGDFDSVCLMDSNSLLILTN